MELEKSFREKITALIFLASQKMVNSGLATQSNFSRYKKLVYKVSKKIENWSNKRAEVMEFFTNDDEFEEVDRSPTKFETSGSEDGTYADITHISDNIECAAISVYTKQENQKIKKLESLRRIDLTDPEVSHSNAIKEDKSPKLKKKKNNTTIKREDINRTQNTNFEEVSQLQEQRTNAIMNMSHKEFFNENPGQSRNFRNETFEKESNYNSYNHKVTDKVEKGPD